MQSPGDAEAVSRKVRNRNHEVGHRVRDAVNLALHQPGAGDLQHLVTNDVTQMERLKQQLEGALQRDGLVECDSDRRVGADRLAVEADQIDVQRHASLLRQFVEHLGERLVPIGRFHLGRQLLLDLQLGRGHP